MTERSDEPMPSATAPSTSTAPATNRGFGRVLVAIYAVFALAATARSLVQITTKFGEAPVAYGLSALSAVIYVLATAALARGDRSSRRVAAAAITVELVGVLVVGALSLLMPADFPRATVWSSFGSGYGFVPLVLPFVGLWWLRHSRPTDEA
jgi:cytochrome bd-type quinol oxidase subunit 2